MTDKEKSKVFNETVKRIAEELDVEEFVIGVLDKDNKSNLIMTGKAESISFLLDSFYTIHLKHLEKFYINNREENKNEID